MASVCPQCGKRWLHYSYQNVEFSEDQTQIPCICLHCHHQFTYLIYNSSQDFKKFQELLLKSVALDIYYSKDTNNYGIRVGALTDACKKYNMSFKDLWNEIIKISDEEERGEL